MTRSMGDAIHLNVPALAAAKTDMAAGYVTGTADIRWTAADWALFPGAVTIDQGYQSPPVTGATVRDVEQGAWTLPAAADLRTWLPVARPTIYCSAAVLPQLAAAGWQGDVWVAAWGAEPTNPYPVPAGMTCVAQQWTDQGGGGAYDLSVVFDPTWPLKGDPMPLTAYQPGSVGLLYTPAGQLQLYGTGQDGRVYVSDLAADGTTSNTTPVTFPLTFQ